MIALSRADDAHARPYVRAHTPCTRVALAHAPAHAHAREQVERSASAKILHIHSGERSLALRADSTTTLDHWVVVLSCKGRAASVAQIESAPSDAPLTSPVQAAMRTASERSGRSRTPTASEGSSAVKLLLLGDTAVGKTSVLTRFSDGVNTPALLAVGRCPRLCRPPRPLPTPAVCPPPDSQTDPRGLHTLAVPAHMSHSDCPTLWHGS